MANRAVCIIPARGGSKRIPRKNIRLFAGKPLIAHSIANALNSDCFKRVIVSTDDEEIAEIANEYGAEVPFRREPGLADDHATTAEVLLDAIQRTGTQNCEFVCGLYPTAPLVTPQDIGASMQLFRDSGAWSMLCTTEFDYSPFRALIVEQGGYVSFQFPENANSRSQDLPAVIHDAGLFYWLRTEEFCRDRIIIGERTLSYPMERLRCIDIDTEEDWRFAEQLYKFHNRADGCLNDG